MRAVITVLGKDMVGILAKVSAKCAEVDVNVIEVTQSILQDLFAMIMMVNRRGHGIKSTRNERRYFQFYASHLI